MADRNTARIFQLPAERIRDPVSEPARTNPSPTAADAIEDEVQEALAICGGDAIAALRITLIANAFLEAQVDRLSAAVSSGFARGKVRKAPNCRALNATMVERTFREHPAHGLPKSGRHLGNVRGLFRQSEVADNPSPY